MHHHSRYQAVARSGVCRKKCRRHEMFIDEKCSWFSRSSELSEMPSISLNSEENKMGVRASYEHYAATRLFFRQTPPGLGESTMYLHLGDGETFTDESLAHQALDTAFGRSIGST